MDPRQNLNNLTCKVNRLAYKLIPVEYVPTTPTGTLVVNSDLYVTNSIRLEECIQFVNNDNICINVGTGTQPFGPYYPPDPYLQRSVHGATSGPTGSWRDVRRQLISNASRSFLEPRIDYENNYSNITIGNDAVAVADQGLYNIAIGYEAVGNYGDVGETGLTGVSYGQGEANTAIGVYSAYDGQSIANTAVGGQAGRRGQAFLNTAVGESAGYSGQINANTAIGASAGYLEQGTANTAVGFEAGYGGQSYYNVAVGAEAVAEGIQIRGNTAVGPYAGYFGQYEGNVAIGLGAGYNGQSLSCVAIGEGAAASSLGSSDNFQLPGSIAIGGYAGADYDLPENGIAIGYNSNVIGLTGSSTYNGIAIGYNTTAQNGAIVISSDNNGLSGALSTLYVEPMLQQDPSTNVYLMNYNTSTAQVGYRLQMDTGYITTVAASGTTNFNFTFATAPNVTANLLGSTINNYLFQVTITSISTTGFTWRKFFITGVGGAAFINNATSEAITWIAVGRA